MQIFTPFGGQSPASGLFALLQPGVTPKAYCVAIGDEIERLIAHLDALDGDADDEDGGDDEPSLAGSYTKASPGDDREGDNADLEPSLGSLGGTATVLWRSRPPAWAGGCLTDRELDDCDLEDGHDAEDDPAERGIADQDGLEEQAGLFDRSGEEPERAYRPWDCEADRARRARLGDIDRRARTLAVRINMAAPTHMRVVRL